MKKLINTFIKDNIESIKWKSSEIFLEKHLLNYFGEKETIKEIVNYFYEVENKNLNSPINIWCMGEKVWKIRMTEEGAFLDCPEGTHYVFDGEELQRVCEYVPNKKQFYKLKK